MPTDSATVGEAWCPLVFLMPSLGSVICFFSGLWSSSPVLAMASGIDGSRCSKNLVLAFPSVGFLLRLFPQVETKG